MQKQTHTLPNELFNWQKKKSNIKKKKKKKITGSTGVAHKHTRGRNSACGYTIIPMHTSPEDLHTHTHSHTHTHTHTIEWKKENEKKIITKTGKSGWKGGQRHSGENKARPDCPGRTSAAPRPLAATSKPVDWARRHTLTHSKRRKTKAPQAVPQPSSADAPLDPCAKLLTAIHKPVCEASCFSEDVPGCCTLTDQKKKNKTKKNKSYKKPRKKKKPEKSRQNWEKINKC